VRGGYNVSEGNETRLRGKKTDGEAEGGAKGLSPAKNDDPEKTFCTKGKEGTPEERDVPRGKRKKKKNRRRKKTRRKARSAGTTKTQRRGGGETSVDFIRGSDGTRKKGSGTRETANSWRPKTVETARVGPEEKVRGHGEESPGEGGGHQKDPDNEWPSHFSTMARKKGMEKKYSPKTGGE